MLYDLSTKLFLFDFNPKEENQETCIHISTYLSHKLNVVRQSVCKVYSI